MCDISWRTGANIIIIFYYSFAWRFGDLREAWKFARTLFPAKTQRKVQAIAPLYYATMLLCPRNIFRKSSQRQYIYIHIIIFRRFVYDNILYALALRVFMSDHASGWWSALVNVKYVLTKLLLRYFFGETIIGFRYNEVKFVGNRYMYNGW